MRRARIVRIEWDEHALEPLDDLIWGALMDYLGSAYTVTGDPSFEVKDKPRCRGSGQHRLIDKERGGDTG